VTPATPRTQGSAADVLQHPRLRSLHKNVRVPSPPHALLPWLFLAKAALDERCEAAEKTDNTPDEQIKKMLLDTLTKEVLSLSIKRTFVHFCITSLALLVTVCLSS